IGKSKGIVSNKYVGIKEKLASKDIKALSIRPKTICLIVL
ncbi:1195_t:CDS:1, partial [Scutellospora calospora]